MSPCKGDIPAFVDNKGQPWRPALCHEQVMVFISVYRIDVSIEPLIPSWNITCTWKIHFADFVSFSPSSKGWQVAIALHLSLSCFFVDVINWKFLYSFLLILLE